MLVFLPLLCAQPDFQSVLHTLLKEAGSDKAGHHGYTRFYDPLFEPLRPYPTRLVEIGVQKGKSMRAWQKYFSNNQSHVFGIGYGNWQTELVIRCEDALQTKTGATVGLGPPCDLYHGDQASNAFLRTTPPLGFVFVPYCPVS
jgi:hypothetical protein